MVLVWALEYVIGLLLIFLNMSPSGSVLVCDGFVAWYCRYVSAVTDLGLMCCLLCVIHLPLEVSCIVYAQSLWLWSPMPITVPCIHSLLSSHWTTTADPMGRDANTGEASLSFLCCLSNNLLSCSSSQSYLIGLWSKTGIMP